MIWFGFGRAFARGLALVLIALLMPGCAQEEMPKTYTVKGKVVYKDGKPFKGGNITFASVANPEQRGYGNIAKDGTFTLNTIGLTSKNRSKLLPGAVEGKFRVTIRIGTENANPAVPDVFRGVQAFTLSKTYKVDATADNDLTVVIE